jgi:hypothetical protein
LFVTVIVYVAVCPTWPVAGPVLATSRSAADSTVISTVAVFPLCSPRESRTVSVASYFPARSYVCEIVGVVVVTGVEPSPKSNVYDAISSSASGSDDPDASKPTVKGRGPVVGEALRTAVGAAFAQKAFPESS